MREDNTPTVPRIFEQRALINVLPLNYAESSIPAGQATKLSFIPMGCCSTSWPLPDPHAAGASSVLLPGTQPVSAKTGWKLHRGVKRTSHGESYFWTAMQIGVIISRVSGIVLIRYIWEPWGIFFFYPMCKVSNIQSEASPLDTEK